MSGDDGFDLTAHLLDNQFTVDRGELAIGGVRVSELAGRFGTPLFVYDAALLRERYRSLRAALPDRVEIYYSVKANPNPAVARCFVEEGAGLEVASGGEFLRARSAGCAAESILFAGPGKGREELEIVIRGGIGEIHLESFEEIEAVESICASMGSTQEVAVRVNPIAAGSGGAMRMGGQPAPFGFDEENLEEVVAALRACACLRLGGVHMFAGTQVLDAQVLIAQWAHAVEVARSVSALSGGPLRTVDLGGGLGIPYFAADRPIDLEELRDGSAELFAPLANEAAFEGTRFILEPGRYLAGPAGVYLARTLSVKRSRERGFAILDGGMHHHLAASGNLGQVIKRDYPIVNASRMGESDRELFTVVGPLCTPLDTLGRKSTMAAPRPGDLVAVLQSGAYGLTASPVGFLSHPMPAEVLLDGGGAHEIRRRGTVHQPITALP